MSNFFKLIKTMSNNDTLTLFIEKNNENQLGIINKEIQRLILRGKGKKTPHSFKLTQLSRFIQNQI